MTDDSGWEGLGIKKGWGRRREKRDRGKEGVLRFSVLTVSIESPAHRDLGGTLPKQAYHQSFLITTTH